MGSIFVDDPAKSSVNVLNGFDVFFPACSMSDNNLICIFRRIKDAVLRKYCEIGTVLLSCDFYIKKNTR